MCRKVDVESSVVLSKEQQKMVFVRRGILVPSGSRCCKQHMYNNHLSYDSFQEITATHKDKITMDTEGVVDLLNECCATIQSMRTFDFDDPASLNEESYYNITGLQQGMPLYAYINEYELISFS